MADYRNSLSLSVRIVPRTLDLGGRASDIAEAGEQEMEISMRTRNPWRQVVAALVAGSALTLAACGNTPSTTSTSTSFQKGGTLTQRVNGDWTTWDLASFPTTVGQYLSMYFYDRLVAVGPKNDIVPYVAKSYNITPTSITFTLRTDVKCADGTPITPTVVANSFHHLLDAPTRSSQANRLFTGGPTKIASDDNAGTVTFTNPTANNELIWGFTNPQAGIICPAGLSNLAGLKDKPAGSGAYALETAVHGDTLTASLRPDWSWGPQGVTAKTAGLPAKVIFKVVASETTAANLISTGGVNLSLVAGPDVARLQADKALTEKDAHAFYAYPLVVNQSAGHAGADVAVRQAIFYAIDPNAWNQAANGGRGIVSSSFLTPDANCYDPGTKNVNPGFSVDKAKSTLTAAGYTLGAGGISKDGKPIAISVLGMPSYGAGTDYLSSQLQSLGFKVDTRNVEISSYASAYQKGDWDVTVNFLPTSTPEPGVNIAFFTGAPPPAGTNFARNLDDKVTARVATTLQAQLSERCKLWATIQQDLLNNHDILPTASPKNIWFSRKVDFQPANTFIEPYTVRILA